MLSIEYYSDSKKLSRVDFAVKKSKSWVDQITRLATVAKRDESNRKEKEMLENKKHELDMARAKN